MMSIHSNEPSRPQSRKEIVNYEPKNFEIAVYTGTRAIAKLNTIQSHLRDVAEDPT